MGNFVVLGASALVLALGVAQASAVPTSQQWQEQVAARMRLPRLPPIATSGLPRSGRRPGRRPGAWTRPSASYHRSR